MWEDVRRCEKMWEDVKMRRCNDRPPLLEEPFAQTLSGKINDSHGLRFGRPMFRQMVCTSVGGHLGIFYFWGISGLWKFPAAIGQLWFKRCHLPKKGTRWRSLTKGPTKLKGPKLCLTGTRSVLNCWVYHSVESEFPIWKYVLNQLISNAAVNTLCLDTLSFSHAFWRLQPCNNIWCSLDESWTLNWDLLNHCGTHLESWNQSLKWQLMAIVWTTVQLYSGLDSNDPNCVLRQMGNDMQVLQWPPS